MGLILPFPFLTSVKCYWAVPMQWAHCHSNPVLEFYWTPVICGSWYGMVLRCFICEEPFNSAKELIKHDKTHNNEEQQHKCRRCDYSCTSALSLKTHSSIHTGEKPFKCGSCDYSCTTAGDLKRHSYTHTGEKPYQCGSCDKSFTTASNLQSHSVRI